MNVIMIDVCSICLQTIDDNNKCRTNCDHEFCKGCLDSWFDSKKVSCPLCRTDIQYFQHNEDLNRVVCIEKKIQRPPNPLPRNPVVSIQRNNYLCLLISSGLSTTLLFLTGYLLSTCERFP